MNFLYFIPLIIFIILLIIKKYKFEKNDLINTVFLGSLTTFAALLFVSIFGKFFPGFDGNVKLISPVLYYIFMAGIPEELAKFLAIKFSKPKSKSAIIVNALLVSLIFSVVEDFGYFAIYESGALLSRVLSIGHVLFQLIMIIYLIKAFNSKQENNNKYKFFNILAVGIPAIFHGFYDAFAVILPHLIYYVIGIITYVLMIVCVLKFVKREENVVEKKKLSAFSIIKVIIIILLSLFNLFAFNPSNKYTPLNEEVNIKEEGIYITIVDVEEIERNEELLDTFNGKYTKIKVKVRNDTSEDKEFSTFSFSLLDGDDLVSPSYISFDNDDLPSAVPAKSEVEGCLYYEGEYKDTYYLTYNTKINLSEGSNKYYFSMKK